MSAMRQTGPMQQATAARMRATAQQLDKTHPETTAAGHVRDAATTIASGRTDGAKRHLDAAMEVLTPRNLARHGILDDQGHTTAKQAMHQVHRLRLAVMDIEDIRTANQAEAERRRSAAADEREAKAKAQAIKTGAFPQPTESDANGNSPAQSPVGKAQPNADAGPGSASGGSQPPVSTPAAAPPPRTTPAKARPPAAAGKGAQLSNVLDLAFDPAQPRDMRGRWAHTPSYHATRMRDSQAAIDRRQRASGLWGAYGTYGDYSAEVARLTSRQRVAFHRATLAGKHPGEALAEARAVGLPQTATYEPGPPQPRRAIYGGRTLDEFLRAKSRLGIAQNLEYVRQSMKGMSPGRALAIARTIQTANPPGGIELAFNPAEPRGKGGEWERLAGEFSRLADHMAAPREQGGHGLNREAVTQVGYTSKLLRRLHQMQHGAGRQPGHEHETGVSVPGSMGLDALIPGKTGTLLSAQLAAIELSARTTMLEHTPAPYGKPGGPGLYGKAGNKHSDYFEQIVQALMRKRGMSKAQASAIAWGAIKRWSAGGGKVHPEVRAAAGRALGQEAVAGGQAHSADSWEMADRLIELAAGGPQWQGEPRTVTGQFGSGGQQGSGGGGKGKAARQARRAQLVRKAAGIRAQIKALEAMLPKPGHKSSSSSKAGKSKSSTPAKKGAGAISSKAASSTKTATHTMSTATIHAKINALRAELAATLRQIHQLSNDGDAIELAWGTAWLHELRGRGGRWTSDGGVSARMIKPVKPPRAVGTPRFPGLRAKIGHAEYRVHSRDDYPAVLAAAQEPIARLAGPHPLQPDTTFDRHGKPLTRAAEHLAAERAKGTAPTPITQEDLQKAIYAAASEMRSAEGKLRETEDRKRRQKLAVHVGAVVGGAALTYAESRVGGVPELAQVMTAPGVLVAQELIDWAKRL